MKSLLFGCNIVSIKELSLAQINQVLDVAAVLKAKPQKSLLQDKLIAHCFFEPSTRTRLSFETATLRLGGQVMGFSSGDHLSTKKGETLRDSVQVIASYADLLVVRHPQEGAARLAADVSSKPVINAGDGANQHPTQALLDLFTIKECQTELNGLSIALVGDLKYGRTIHSFVDSCIRFDIRLFLVAPDALTLPDAMCDQLKKEGVRFSFHRSIEEILPKVDVLYMTRIQRERFVSAEQLQLKQKFSLNANMLKQVKPNLKILHPLPRVDEMDISVDSTPYAMYFQQAENGVYVRQALLTLLLNETFHA